MFIALLIIAKSWRLPECPSTGERKSTWYVLAENCCSVMKGPKLSVTQMKHKNPVLREP